jgi:hypothetical protein
MRGQEPNKLLGAYSYVRFFLTVLEPERGRESVWEGEYGGDIMYLCMKMDK